MALSARHSDLWSVARGSPWIDPDQLLAAIEAECGRTDHDFRTRLLLRDSADALERYLGRAQLDARLSPAAKAAIDRVRAEPLDEPGFPSLADRLMPHTDPETILEFLRELGAELRSPARMDIGGSSALILAGLLSRNTEDVDAVDEVPAEARADHALLARLTQRFGLRLAHFRSHYLPNGWSGRVRSLGRFGALDVYLVDPSDIFVGKLFSAREKDRDDLRILKRSLDKATLSERVRTTAQSFAADPKLRADAEKNWYVLYGEPVPT